MRCIPLFLILVLPGQLMSQSVNARPRAREAGLKVGVLPVGPLNAITDVGGVRVGHTTIIRGENIRTGVTAILPHSGNLFREKVPAAIFVANGFGLDTVQRWLVVEPVRAIARATRFVDVSGVEGAEMGLGRVTSASGSALAAWHRAALPRAFAAVLGAAALLAIAGVTLSLVGLW